MTVSKTLLVVEDDRLLGKSLKEYLEEAGYTVVWARESGEAYNALRDNDVELILLDIMLPGENGYQILKRLKAKDSEYRNISVVMLTNLGQISEMDRALDLGASDYVIKSNTDLEKLVDMVKEKIQVIHAKKDS